MFYWDQFWLTQSAFILYGTVDLDIVNCMIHSADPGPIHASKKGNLYRLPFFEAWTITDPVLRFFCINEKMNSCSYSLDMIDNSVSMTTSYSPISVILFSFHLLYRKMGCIYEMSVRSSCFSVHVYGERRWRWIHRWVQFDLICPVLVFEKDLIWHSSQMSFNIEIRSDLIIQSIWSEICIFWHSIKWDLFMISKYLVSTFMKTHNYIQEARSEIPFVKQ